jgi:hypothetical protein
LCVSGLPHRNGNVHAREIAEMSLSFMRSLIDYEIPNMPSERINLRIGIHTGQFSVKAILSPIPKVLHVRNPVEDSVSVQSVLLPDPFLRRPG